MRGRRRPRAARAPSPTTSSLRPSPRAGVCKRDSAGAALSAIVMITDSCPECEADHLDVQSKAFAKVGKGVIQQCMGVLENGGCLLAFQLCRHSSPPP